jgi:hypothetical protein
MYMEHFCIKVEQILYSDKYSDSTDFLLLDKEEI